MNGQSADKVRRAQWLPQWGPRAAWLALALAMSGIVAVSVAQGRTKMWFGLVALSAAIVLASLGRTARLRVLVLAVVLSSLLFGPSAPIPLGLTLTEAMLIFVALAELLATPLVGHHKTFDSILGPPYYVPFALFALFGLVATYINGEVVGYWPTVCLVPLLILFSVERLTKSTDDVLWLVRAAVAAILMFVAIVVLAIATGHTQGVGEGAWRLADHRAVALGPLSFMVWSIRLGSLVAMGLPAALVLAARARHWRERVVYTVIVAALLLTLGLTFARGATIAAAAGGVVAMLVSRRVRMTSAVFGLGVVLLIAVVAGPALLTLLPRQGIERFAVLGRGLGSVYNFVYRTKVMEVTLHGIAGNPLGPGFGYLWDRFRIDESIVYSLILNGTGILGFCAFVAMLVQLARGYVSGLSRRLREAHPDLAAIGLGTLVAAMVAGVSSHSVFVEPVQTTVFWVLAASTLVGCMRCRALERDSIHSAESTRTDSSLHV
jgi:hypothetical protein